MILRGNETSNRAALLTPRRFALVFYSLFSVFASLQAVGCGAPGEPAERKAPIPVAVTDLAASQQGNDVILVFTLPKESVERKPLKQLPAVEVYRCFAPFSGTTNAPHPVAAPINSDLLVTIPPELVDHFADRGQFRYVDSLSAEDLKQYPDSQVVYVVRTRTSSKKVSAESNQVSVGIEPAPDPITDLSATTTRDAAVLTWTAPQKTIAGTQPPIATFSIYRAEGIDAQPISSVPAGTPAASDQKPNFAHIADAPAAPFSDAQAEFGKTYIYSVRTVAQYAHVRVESADSNFTSVARLDTFPPPTPEGLVAALIPADGQTSAYLDLSWSINPDNNIAGYNIYRSEGAGTNKTKLNSAFLLTPAFRDMNVLSGRHYLYTVTAVDRAGNESPESAPVTGSTSETGAPPESR
jgi:fibronectin type 3 domain-containing protein